MLTARGEEINLDWKIGCQLNNVRGKREDLKKELESRNVFSEEIIKSIAGNERSSRGDCIS